MRLIPGCHCGFNLDHQEEDPPVLEDGALAVTEGAGKWLICGCASFSCLFH